MDLAEAVKKIFHECMKNENLSDVVYATYTGTGLKIEGKPSEVQLDMVDMPLHLQSITGKLSCDLSGGFVIKAKDGNGKEITVESIELTDAPVVITTGLAIGARVAVVQKTGAGQYSIIDEVGA